MFVLNSLFHCMLLVLDAKKNNNNNNNNHVLITQTELAVLPFLF